MAEPAEPFVGAKLLLFVGDSVVVIRRDERPDIPWPGRLDFPGGGREGFEDPEECVLRETEEEIGLRLTRSDLHVVGTRRSDAGVSWFFAARLPADAQNAIRLGSEGTEWMRLDPHDFARRTDAVPHFRHIMSEYLETIGGKKMPGPADGPVPAVRVFGTGKDPQGTR
ncbi:NUDIX domain protein [Roseivivax jejudonensis]|uniref:NUDIX domain protein n=1 Tax=Roseivivax jejudonensis TaxID=1529041 RepID=A0A1X6ZUK8_9RHOB|nr:NUDIX hydrolase [Roseivivax jejudonensis]SLN61581.1 NUDIX domain protein [Roseivivax jejudonensis]